MTQAAPSHEKVMAGETASIENVHSAALSISLSNEDGCKFDLELVPGQILSFTAGQVSADLVLHHGDPRGLRVIKPGASS
jgi:hypothetical protein